MHTRETDEAVESLPDGLLRQRLARTDWERNPKYISDEQVFRLFRRVTTRANFEPLTHPI